MANKVEQHNRPRIAGGGSRVHLPPAAAAEQQAKQQADIQRQMAEQMAAARQEARIAAMQGAIDHPSEVQQYIDFTASMASAAGGASVIMLGLPNGKRVDVLLSPDTARALAAAITERLATYELEQDEARPDVDLEDDPREFNEAA